MANRDLDTKGTNSPLASAEAVICVVLPDTSDDEALALAGETLSGSLLVCSVGSHALAETTIGAHGNAADLLEPERVHDVADGCLCAGRGGGGGVLPSKKRGKGGGGAEIGGGGMELRDGAQI